jgi:hypothetical protein
MKIIHAMFVGTVLGGALAAGCTTETDAPAPSAQEPLRALEIAPDFTFATTRSVSLRVEATAASLGGARTGALEIARPDGKVLYRGPILANRGVELPLVMPAAARSVHVRIKGDGASAESEVDLASGSVEHRFE